MIHPTPAIVSQHSARRLPRWVLWTLGLLYILPGFIGREPWRNADLAAFGVMRELAAHPGQWLQPQLLGESAETIGWLPYWLGALSIHALPWLPAHQAAQLPFMALLALTLISTWYAAYYLARLPGAQPVVFAFGGQANPTDYARALADAALLALLACLGLALLAHQSSVDAARLAFVALALAAFARSVHLGNSLMPTLGLWALAMFGLALSGAPGIALLLLLSGELARRCWPNASSDKATEGAASHTQAGRALAMRAGMAGLALGAAAVAFAIGWPGGWLDWQALLAHWQLATSWESLARLLLWFTWPCALLAAWTLWKWRRQWRSPHLLLPAACLLALLLATFVHRGSDRILLLALPALALLAAFALPTLTRSVAALIDWLAILLFSVSALLVWIIWLAMMTGVPAEPAANVAKLLPNFVPRFEAHWFVPALLLTLAWLAVIAWRTGRHQPALWKSLVLSASGITLCWSLLLTLWLPVLNHGMGLAPISQRVAAQTPAQQCVLVHGLMHEQIAALQYHGGLRVQRITGGPADASCTRLVVSSEGFATLSQRLDVRQWQLLREEPRLRENRDVWLVFERRPGAAAPQ
ncbi:MAG: hypothetical protein Q7J58_14435 [Hydrogenophaga sp.]|uniref:hypothetical protein n=1 Tax=Hydrogenophaga sp. TaxID=1904254 RepID=UPI00271B7F3C|nr:hypothetical protein [Hydrogenophaga sp.]MDO9570550.1 hypothetical protein [Hydrogenophaga sp.]